MSIRRKWLRDNGYLIIGLLLLLFGGLFSAIQGVESRLHTDYLELLRQLRQQDNHYNMELYRVRFQDKRDFDTLLTVDRRIGQLLDHLQSPPNYLDTAYALGIENLVHQLLGEFEEKREHTSRFKSAKALYNNSIRYLPLLHDQVDHLKTVHNSSLVDDVYHLTEEMLAYISDHSRIQVERQNRAFIEEIDHYRSQLQRGQEPDSEILQIITALLRHIELIITTVPAIEYHLIEASSSGSAEAITRLHDLYLSGYRKLQEKIQHATNLLLLFTLTLFAALLYAVFNLRRTQQQLEEVNRDLESRVTQRTTALNNAKEYAEKVTQSMSEALLVTDTHGEILSCNPAAESLIGVEPNTLAATNLRQWIGAPINNPDYHSGETTLTDSRQQEIPINVSRSALHGTDQSIYGYTYVVLDLRERIHAEQQQQYLAFQSGIAEMGVTVMHNIGNIMTGMTGSIELARQGAEMVKRTAGALNIFLQQLQRSSEDRTTDNRRTTEVVTKTAMLLETVTEEKLLTPLENIREQLKNIGDLIRLHENEFQPERPTGSNYNLRALIDDVIHCCSASSVQSEITLYNEVPESLTLKHLPRNQLHQTLSHLLDNSIEAIQQRQADTQEHFDAAITFRTGTTGEYWYLEVEDNGCGIDDAISSQIFNFGFSTKEDRSGYGLHAAGNFIQGNRGRIELRKGHGNWGTVIRALFTRQ